MALKTLKYFIIASDKIKIFLLIIPLFINVLVFAEGTKEIMPQTTTKSKLYISTTYSTFANYGCPVDTRLQIHIENIGEKIYYGFGSVTNSQLVYRIKDASGNIVVPETTIPKSGAGFISTHPQALAGPNAINPLGYNPLLYTPTTTGDFYIEFSTLPRRISWNATFDYFDITVASSTNIPINGRVWSKEWSFNTTSFVDAFSGKIYTYSDDSVVTSVNFNGMQPYLFTIAINSTGVANSGNPLIDRKSVNGNSTFPKYKIFLNDPDPLVFPSGTIGHFTSPVNFSGCPGNYCINVSVNKKGKVRSFIDLNGIPGYQQGTSDLEIITDVNVGSNCILWNGLDGQGNPVPSGTLIKLSIKYISGVTHMPLYDVERNVNGFMVNLVRPKTATTSFQLFWDDSNFPGAITPPSNGCNSVNGCHAFTDNFGDNRTINTWWYASNDVEDSLQFVYNTKLINNIDVKNVSCAGLSNGKIEIKSQQSGLSYSINGGVFQTDSVFSNLNQGSYNIGVINIEGCKSDSTIIITAPDSLRASLVTTMDTCNSGVGRASIKILSGASPMSYLWNGNPITTNNIDSLRSGLYKLVITDAYGCAYNFSDSVKNINSDLIISSEIVSDTCGLGKGSIKINTSQGFSPINYLWNTTPAQTTSSITGQSGTYHLTITEQGLCKSSRDYTIPDVSFLNPTPFSNTSKICLGDTLTIRYTPKQGETYILSAPNGTIISESTGIAKLLYKTSGMHTISLTTKRGSCSEVYTDTVEVIELSTTITTIDPSCAGLSDGKIEIKSKQSGLSYSINGGVFQTDSVFSNLNQGSYNIGVINIEGCKSDSTIIITAPDSLRASLVTTMDTCNSGVGRASIKILSGASPMSYLWNGNPITTNNIDSLRSGLYKLVITDAYGCAYNFSDSVKNINSDLIISSEIVSDTCGLGKGSIKINTSQGFSPINYLWNTTPAQTTSSITGQSGTYHLTITEQGLCKSSRDYTIPDLSFLKPTPFTSTSKICLGDTITMNYATTPLLTYSISAPNGTITTNTTGRATISYNTRGKHYISLTINRGSCSATYTDSVEVSQVSNPTATISNVSCAGLRDGKIEIKSKQSGLSYSINGGIFQTDSVFSNLNQGSYNIEVKNIEGCKSDSTIIITAPDSLIATLTTSLDTCNSGVGRASIKILSGASPMSYLWNGKPINTNNIDSLRSGLYALVITDAYGCSYNFSDSVKNINSDLIISSEIVSDTCGLGKGSITINTSQGFKPINYVWNTTPAQTTSSITGQSGTYHLTITEQGLCKSIRDYTIPDLSFLKPTPFTRASKICLGDTLTIRYTPKQGETYILSAPSGTIISESTGIAKLLYRTSGMHPISLTTKRGNCSEVYVDSIEVIEMPNIEATIKNVSCFGGNDGHITINKKDTTNSYYFETTKVTYSNIDNLTAGDYNLSVENTIGCKLTKSFKVIQPQPVDIHFNSEDASCNYICDGKISGSVSGGTQPYSYNWNISSFGEGLEREDVCVGEYTIYVVDSNGCLASKTIKINNSTSILANFDYYFNTQYRQQNIVNFVFTGYGAEDYLWNFEETFSTEENPTHKFSKDSTHTISLIVNSGSPNYCVDTVVKHIKVELPSNIYVPTAFTPNGDGLNDRFVVFTTNIIKYEFHIYNRYGKEVFHSNDETYTWDGVYKGEKAPAGVYAYLLIVVDAQGKQFTKRGAFTLIR